MQANLDKYQVVIYSDTVKRKFSQDCSNTSCLFIGLPPVEYSLTATASGYLDIKQNINIPKNDLESVHLSFEKKITLEKLSDTFTPALSSKEKIVAFNARKLYKLIDNQA